MVVVCHTPGNNNPVLKLILDYDQGVAVHI